MKLIAYEMPENSKECPFSLNHDPNADCWIDIAIDPPKWYCELTKKECDLSNNHCSGLFNADRMMVCRVVDHDGRLVGHKFQAR